MQKTFILQKKKLKNSSSPQIFPVIDENKNNVYYIINYTDGGFIILAADTRSIPILAYSEDNSFPTDSDDYPEGLIEWLEMSKDQIKEIRDKNLEQPEEFILEWDKLDKVVYLNQFPSDILKSSCTPIFQLFGPLLQSKWNQGPGYNEYMPTAADIGCSYIGSGNNRAYAGCVPIAAAQVMKYHQFPSNYNWAAMPNGSYGNLTTSQLILDMHIKLHQNSVITYNCGTAGTGVSSNYDMSYFFKTKFGYSSADNNNSFYMPNFARIASEVMQNRPVILKGGRKSGWWIFASKKDGHMWVCDGLAHRRMCLYIPNYGVYTFNIMSYHMNWGWGGNYNGYYLYGQFNPGGSDFNYQVNVLYNIKP